MACVNVKVQHIRPDYNNLQDLCQNPNNVYIGRRGVVFINTNGEKSRYPKSDSPFCNPFKIDFRHTRSDVLASYRTYILEKIQSREVDLEELRGKTLGCWCKPEDCHGDILIELLNQNL